MKLSVLYLLAVNTALVFLGVLAAYAATHGRRERRGMVAVAAGGAVWAFTVAAMALSDPPLARVWLSAKYTALGVTNIAMFLFIARHTGVWGRTTVAGAAAFLAIPVVGHLGAWSDRLGVFRDATFGRAYDLTYLVRLDYTGIYTLTTAYHFALVLVGLGCVVVYMRRGGAIARGQGGALLLAMGVPAAVNVLMLSEIVPRVFDVMPLGHTVSAAALFWGVYRHQMLDLAPVARHALVDTLEDGILIVDGQGRILDANARLGILAGVAPRTLLGQSIDQLPGGGVGGALRAMAAGPGAAAPPTSVHDDGRSFELRMVPAGGADARVLVVHDVTERQRWHDEQARLIGELQAALRDVKTLSGLLPICAGCKKIRDDAGAWLPMERYIRDRTDARFSHGMCPECVAVWYPEVDGSA